MNWMMTRFLIMEYVAKDAPSGKQRDRALQKVFERKAESDSYLPIPLCCCLYRPEKVSKIVLMVFVRSLTDFLPGQRSLSSPPSSLPFYNTPFSDLVSNLHYSMWSQVRF